MLMNSQRGKKDGENQNARGYKQAKKGSKKTKNEQQIYSDQCVQVNL
jgi:hypothetical protein